MSDNAAWIRLLDQMEQELRVAEQILDENPAEGVSENELHTVDLNTLNTEDSSWLPPKNLGPLPPELSERVKSLVARQVAISDQLEDGLDALRRQRRAVEHADQNVESSPVYLNVEG